MKKALSSSEINAAIENIVSTAKLREIVTEQNFWGVIELSFKDGNLTVVKTITTTLPKVSGVRQ